LTSHAPAPVPKLYGNGATLTNEQAKADS